MQIVGKILLYLIAGAVLLFLIAPILLVMPMAFSHTPYFQFPVEAYSLRWFKELLGSSVWLHAIYNSIVIASMSTLLAVSLGTLAAIGLNQRDLPGKRFIMTILISPMIVPVIVLAVGSYFFYSKLGIANSLSSIVLVHAVLGMPFVVITVTAALSGFNMQQMWAARGLGADAWKSFRYVMFPAIRPGILSGAVFAFVTSFDEVVAVLFLGGPEQTTLPKQMWIGLREQLSPTILSAAFLLISITTIVLLLETLRHHRSVKYTVTMPLSLGK